MTVLSSGTPVYEVKYRGEGFPRAWYVLYSSQSVKEEFIAAKRKKSNAVKVARRKAKEQNKRTNTVTGLIVYTKDGRVSEKTRYD